MASASEGGRSVGRRQRLKVRRTGTWKAARKKDKRDGEGEERGGRGEEATSLASMVGAATASRESNQFTHETVAVHAQ